MSTFRQGHAGPPGYVRCTTCGDFALFPTRHVCPPRWEVRICDERDKPEAIEREDADELNWTTVYARDAEDAATKAAEDYDNDGDYTIINGNGEYRARVRPVPYGPIEVFVIEAEARPLYWARRAEAP